MNKSQLRFQPENFVVHYITLNLRETVEKEDLCPIAKYLSDHCNSNSTLFTETTRLQKSFYYKPSNKDEIEFRIYYYNPKEKNFWEGTQIYFKGDSAIPLYEWIKTQKFQWDIFRMEKLKIGRFDVHYFLAEDFRNKRELVHNFFSKSLGNALSQGVHAEIDKDGVLRICKRDSPHHLRVYLKDKEIIKTVYSQLVHGLEFELEIKKSTIKRFLF